MNVVGNAIKFSEGGRVDLNVSFVNGRLIFEVVDTGRGISEEQVSGLFQPFSQADSSTTRKFGGTGLGLVLTKRLCLAMGGDFILKESALGKGSTFVASVQVLKFSSPSVDQVVNDLKLDSTLEKNTNGQGELSNLRVLLVEDSPDNQELIKIILSKAGAQVDIADDGLSGIEMALANQYSAILMDVQMPRMDGVEAARLLRQRGIRLPIVALTAHAMKQEQDRCLHAGFSHFLTKPIDREALIDVLSRAASVGNSQIKQKKFSFESS